MDVKEDRDKISEIIQYYKKLSRECDLILQKIKEKSKKKQLTQ